MPRPSDLPDPLNDSQHLQLDNVEDLLSRLADREINRMIGPNGTQYDLMPVELDPAAPPPVLARARARATTPVQELDGQLGSFLGAIQSRPPAPAPQPLAPPQVTAEWPSEPAVVRAEPAPAPPRVQIASTEHDAHSRRALIAPIEAPAPALVRMLAWLNGPVIDMSPRGRLAVSVVSILAFAGSISVLGYVLMLRHG